MNPKVEFEAGNYEGQLSDSGSPEGLGKMTYNNGSIYNGQWKRGKPHGTGCMVFISGEVYSGEFDLGVRSGMGNMKSVNGENYFGHWENNKQNGTGQLIYKSGDFFKGHFMNGKKHGHGMEKEKEIIFVGFWNLNIQIGTFFCFNVVTGLALEVTFKNGEIQNASVLNPYLKNVNEQPEEPVKRDKINHSRSLSCENFKKKQSKSDIKQDLNNIQSNITSSKFNEKTNFGNDFLLMNSNII